RRPRRVAGRQGRRNDPEEVRHERRERLLRAPHRLQGAARRPAPRDEGKGDDQGQGAEGRRARAVDRRGRPGGQVHPERPQGREDGAPRGHDRQKRRQDDADQDRPRGGRKGVRLQMKRALLVLALAGCAEPRETVYERSIPDAIEDGVDYLVRTQSPDGSWGQGRETTDFDVMAAVPGSHDAFRVGTTALCVKALREAGERKASARGLHYLATYDGVRRANRAEIYNIWAHLYALETLSRAWAEDKIEAYKKSAEWHLQRLEMYETYIGGWNYYDFIYGTEKPSMEPTSFGTAAGLVALQEARKAGIAVPEGLIRRALARLKEMKNPDGSFLYGSDFRYHPRHLANRDKGSLGRTQSCYYALQRWNEG